MLEEFCDFHGPKYSKILQTDVTGYSIQIFSPVTRRQLNKSTMHIVYFRVIIIYQLKYK